MSLAGRTTDVVVVGGGHNALVAATLLAREGLDVLVLERLPHVGGAAVSARPFAGLDARLSRYSYLVSLLPQALVDDLGLRLELRSRPTASFTPYERDGRSHGLLVSTDDDAVTRRSFRELTGSDAEHDAWCAFYDEVEELAGAVAPTLLDPLPRRSDLRARSTPGIWTDLVERPLGEAIERRFAHDLVRGVVATDALIGTFASLHDPSLVQNRCFLYHLIGNGTGEWRVPVGGMGAVTGELERVARAAGARIETGREVWSVQVAGDGVEVRWRGTDPVDQEGIVSAPWLLSGIAPSALDDLVDTPTAPVERPLGSQLKVNLLLSRLPALRSGADPAVAFAGTFHVNEAYSQLEELHGAARRGEAPFAAGELYCHTLTDRSILGPELASTTAQTLTYFGLHAPDSALGSDRLGVEAAGARAYGQVIAALEPHLAEPLAPLVLGVEHKTPAQVADELAMPGGHIFHGDLSWPWLEDGESADSPARRWGVATTHDRILVCGSGARRGGAVSGIGGHDAARALLEVVRP